MQGEVAKCVAMNPKNGMKKEAKREKGKDAAVNGGAALHSTKKTER